MEHLAVTYIKHFIQAFILKENSMLDLKIQHEIPEMKSLLDNFTITEKYAEKLIENEAPKFNLFRILQIYHLESKVHTPFLVELINPEGNHRQGRIFFNAFIKHLFGEAFNQDIITNISVAKEFSDYSNGRMDILIKYRLAGVPNEIVIENKIYHHDEKEQLTRYHRYLTKTRGLKEGQFHLIYLTPYKSKPTTASISTNLYDTLTAAKALTEWGYYEDIDFILKGTIADIKAPVVRESIIQYIDAIQFL